MANTVIQLKYSTVTATPVALNVAEPAYSYTSNTLFIGSPSGTGSIAIGGKFYLDQQQAIYDSVNAAFATANAAGTSSFAQDAYNHSNAAFDTANTANDRSLSAGIYANGAFIRANNSLSANAGGTVTGNVTIVGDFAVTGNMTITGNVKTIDVETLNITDPLIYLAANNYGSDVVDIGFAANYFDGTQKHTGFIRHAADDIYYLFFNYGPEPQNNIIDVSDPTFRVATLNANIVSQTISVRGVELLTFAQNAYNAANSATAADSTQNASITAAFNAANSAGIYANGAFAKANTDVTDISISAADYGSATRVASFKLEANGRISSANSTLIALDASQITSGTFGVARGGTGNTSLQLNSVLIGQGTSAVTAVGSSVEGHVLTINSSGVPRFEHLSGGTF